MDDEEIRARAAALLAGDLPDEEALAGVVSLLSPAAFGPADEALLEDLAEMVAPRCATLTQALAG